MRKEETSALVFATSSSLRQEGKLDASKLVKQINESPGRAGRIMKAFDKSNKEPQSLTPSEGVALIAQLQLTREQYEVLRKWAIKKSKFFQQST